MQNNSEINLKADLEDICEHLLFKMEYIFFGPPTGACYLIGNCLARGLSETGIEAKAVTGSLVLKDQNCKNVVYGNNKYGGINVGYYHTWCEVEYMNKILIVDPSIRFNRIHLRKEGINLNTKIPDILITEKSRNWLYSYYPDIRLIEKSQHDLNMLDEEIPNFFASVIMFDRAEKLMLLAL